MSLVQAFNRTFVRKASMSILYSFRPVVTQISVGTTHHQNDNHHHHHNHPTHRRSFQSTTSVSSTTTTSSSNDNEPSLTITSTTDSSNDSTTSTSTGDGATTTKKNKNNRSNKKESVNLTTADKKESDNLTTADIIDFVALAHDLSKAETRRILDTITGFIVDSLAEKKTNKFKVVGLGTFKIATTKARNGRNPRTGEALVIPKKERLRFLPLRDVKDRINGSSVVPTTTSTTDTTTEKKD